MKQLMTKWGNELDRNNVKQEYPRPNMVRGSYLNLNGQWDCCINHSPECSEYDRTILVPFSPESVLSGVGVIVQPENYLHYRKRFTLPEGIVFNPPYAEVTLKDDIQGDPLISERLCIMKGLLKEGQYDEALNIVHRVGEVLKNELAPMGLTLIDFKIEVGYDETGKMFVADEITPDIWRVRDENGNIPNQLDCSKLLLKKMGL